jgi:hypothetical protein
VCAALPATLHVDTDVARPGSRATIASGQSDRPSPPRMPPAPRAPARRKAPYVQDVSPPLPLHHCNTSRAHRIAPPRFTARTWFHSASLADQIAASAVTPALFTNTSTRPRSSNLPHRPRPLPRKTSRPRTRSQPAAWSDHQCRSVHAPHHPPSGAEERLDHDRPNPPAAPVISRPSLSRGSSLDHSLPSCPATEGRTAHLPQPCIPPLLPDGPRPPLPSSSSDEENANIPSIRPRPFP